MGSAARDSQRTFLLEHYRPGITVGDFREIARRMRRAAEQMSSGRSPIRLLRSTLAPEDETAFCVFAASSQATVEDAYRHAGVSFERIVEAQELQARGAV